MKIAYTREQVEAVYDEVDRRLEMDIRDGYFYNKQGNFQDAEYKDYRAAMLQGVYSALMATASNWSEVVTSMIVPIEERRYWAELGYED